MGLTHIGQITSHKGLKGNLTLKVKNKFDFDLKNLKFIYAEIKSNKIPFEIEKINIVKETTQGNITKNSFIYDFMSSMRQKINDPLGVRAKKRKEISQR